MQINITCTQDGKTFHPVVLGEVLFDAMNTAGKLFFRAMNFPIRNGALCSLEVNKAKIFTGYVFNIHQQIEQTEGKTMVEVTAYDAMKYLNVKKRRKDKRGTAGDLLRAIAVEYKIPLGHIQDTGEKFPKLYAESESLYQTIGRRTKNFTVRTNGEGKLMLYPLGEPKLPLCVTAHHCQSVDEVLDIGTETYNRITLTTFKNLYSIATEQGVQMRDHHIRLFVNCFDFIIFRKNP